LLIYNKFIFNLRIVEVCIRT